MRFYHKLVLVALLSGSVTAGAQPQRPAVPAEQDVDDDEGPPPQARQVAPPPGANDGMRPRRRRAESRVYRG